MLDVLRAASRLFEAKDRLVEGRRGAQPDHHRRRLLCPIPEAARHRPRRASGRRWRPSTARNRRCAALFVAAGYFTLTFYDLFAVRTIGPQRRALPHLRAGRIHLLFDRPQRRRQRLHRRRGALPHLFRLGHGRHRRGANLLHRRADVLARQCRRPRHRLHAASGGRLGHRPASRMVQPRARHHRADRAWSAYVAWVWRAPRAIGRDNWVVQLPRRPADAVADPDRHRRSDLLRAGHVHAGAGKRPMSIS